MSSTTITIEPIDILLIITLSLIGGYSFVTYLNEVLVVPIIFFWVMLIIFAVLFFRNYIEIQALPQAHNVAILGLPKSGKTTLIISIWSEIYSGRIPIDLSPRGTTTIERISESLDMLEKGKALGPTKDQDRFGFRGVLKKNKFPFNRNFRVEFGDFPGEASEKYSEKIQWLHNNEFFKWVADSDAIIFVIDIAHYLTGTKKSYISSMTNTIRAAWQQYLDINSHRIDHVTRHPLLIVFTKADLFGVSKIKKDQQSFEAKIAKLGFGNQTPEVKEIDRNALLEGGLQLKEDFYELINYLNHESQNFHVVITSSFGLDGKRRIGLEELLRDVLPN